MAPATTKATHTPSHLFMVRVWREQADSPSTVWRGKVQSLPDGEAYYFHTWARLIAHLQAMMESEHSGNTISEPEKGDNP